MVHLVSIWLLTNLILLYSLDIPQLERYLNISCGYIDCKRQVESCSDFSCKCCDVTTCIPSQPPVRSLSFDDLVNDDQNLLHFSNVSKPFLSNSSDTTDQRLRNGLKIPTDKKNYFCILHFPTKKKWNLYTVGHFESFCAIMTSYSFIVLYGFLSLYSGHGLKKNVWGH